MLLYLIGLKRDDLRNKHPYETSSHFLLARKASHRMIIFWKSSKKPAVIRLPSYKSEDFSSESDDAKGVQTQQSQSFISESIETERGQEMPRYPFTATMRNEGDGKKEAQINQFLEKKMANTCKVFGSELTIQQDWSVKVGGGWKEDSPNLS